ncbi:MAG: PPOX class F420-dependent oxidoreductase [Acidimicrobiia bacterium]
MSSMNWSTAKYVSFTTFRSDGSAVSTPVWFAPLGNEFVFSTDPSSWKVKRLAKNDRIEIRPCSVRGTVAPDAPVASGTARVITAGSEYQSVVAALKKKYGFMVTLIEWGGALKQFIKRNPSPDCAVIVSITA